MDLLRTPDSTFVGLTDWPFPPHYLEVDGVRIAYLDEGPRDGPVALLLHGEPTWSYLYRHMVPPLVAAGVRAIAPDLVGFGRSEKPAAQADHTYARHVGWMAGLLTGLELRDLVLFAQDWGSLIGLRVVAEHSDRFAGIVLSNGGLPTGDQRVPEAFTAWQAYAATADPLPIGALVSGGARRELTPEEIAAYDAPFPGEEFKAGPKALPSLVPTTPDNPASEANREAWRVLEAFEGPLVCAFSDGDPITRGADRRFRERVPGAAGQPHVTVSGGHFVQEDAPAELAAAVARLALMS